MPPETRRWHCALAAALPTPRPQVRWRQAPTASRPSTRAILITVHRTARANPLRSNGGKAEKWPRPGGSPTKVAFPAIAAVEPAHRARRAAAIHTIALTLPPPRVARSPWRRSTSRASSAPAILCREGNRCDRSPRSEPRASSGRQGDDWFGGSQDPWSFYRRLPLGYLRSDDVLPGRRQTEGGSCEVGSKPAQTGQTGNCGYGFPASAELGLVTEWRAASAVCGRA